MRSAISPLFLILMASPAMSAPSAILCIADDHTAIIQLEGLIMNGHTYNCIDADFVDPYTPCATVGAYTLYEDGSRAKIVGVVERPEDYADHTGGVMSHTMEGDNLTLTAGYTAPDSGYVELWSFTVMLATDAGVLTSGTLERPYTCNRL